VPRNAPDFIRSHHEWAVYQLAFEQAMIIFELTKRLPVEERYALTDQMRRSSRAVCANLAEAWRRRRYPGNFIARLNDAEAEAAETQTWLHFAVQCQYLPPTDARPVFEAYNQIIGTLVNLRRNPDPWLIQ
jgi:four helix bundle protein